MISCVITTLKVNRYQRKSYLLRINFIISCQLIKKNQIMRLWVSGLQGAYYKITLLFLSIHVMKVAGISPFNHLKLGVRDITGILQYFPRRYYIAINIAISTLDIDI